MYVKPADKKVNGKPLQVRDPISKQHLPAEGQHVPDDDTYWIRRLTSGDVVAAKPPAVVQVNQISDSAKREE